MIVSGARAVAEALQARGARVAFARGGDLADPLLEACRDAGIRIVDARDERGAAWMAAGFALATGASGVVILPSTPALTNAATALAHSKASGIPVVCVTGDTSDDFSIEEQPSAPQERPALEGAIAEARTTLSRAGRPAILAGSGVFWTGAGNALRRLAEATRIPVFTAGAARGLLSDHHDLCFGFTTGPARALLGEADVAVLLGCYDVDLVGGPMGGTDAFAPDGVVIRADADPAAIDAIAAGALPTDDWLKRLTEASEAHAAEVAARARLAGTPMHPGRLVAEIAAKLPENAMVTVDAGELTSWALDAIPARAPSSVHSASAPGALGMGLPWAIGMKVARPDRPVLALVDDASLGLSAMELETSARHGAPVAVVVGNRGGSPYELLAEFAGGVGDRVETPKQLEIAVTNALVAGVPSVVNAIVSTENRPGASASAS